MSHKKLYIGNLHFEVTENDLHVLFNQYSPIHSAFLISDKYTNRSRGFGFMELDDDKAKIAIDEMNNKMFRGRNLRVKEATGISPREIIQELKDIIKHEENQSQKANQTLINKMAGQLKRQYRYQNMELYEKCPYCNQYIVAAHSQAALS